MVGLFSPKEGIPVRVGTSPHIKPKLLVAIFVVLFILATTSSAKAVPPPDFIFNVGSQLIQAFAFILVFFTATFGALSQVLRQFFATLLQRKIFLALFILLILGISFGGAYAYEAYRQQQEYRKWQAESNRQDPQQGLAADNLDKLNPSISPAPAESAMPEDPEMAFLRSYYHNIELRRFAEAYAVSKQTVSFETFKDWYKNITALNINGIQKIADHKYSLRLDLHEGDVISYYAVLTEVAMNEDGSYRIANSDVKILEGPDVTPIATDVPLEVANAEFQSIINQNVPRTILDAREDEEYGYGRFPDSLHIRFADLKAGQWVQLPGDQPIYVICWSGIRGREVAEFLRSKHLIARYLQEGANGWVQSGGTWEGEISFAARYLDDRYKIVFTTDQMKQMIDAGNVTIVDSREQAKYDTWHIPGSINIPIIYTPTSQLEAALSQVPAGASVVAICDDFVNCFDAKIAGVKLEARGAQFLGRYNKPWELH